MITNLENFRAVELEKAIKLLQALNNSGFPEDFKTLNVKLAFNENEFGDVFLMNEDFELCSESEGRLYSYYSAPFSDLEGSIYDLADEYKNMCKDDREWLEDIVKTYYSDEITLKN